MAVNSFGARAFLLHALIGMVDVSLVFVVSLYVEERLRGRTLHRDWS